MNIEKPPFGWAVATSVSVLALYALTLAPTTAFWDASEYIATAHILGIPHPPGNPLFVVLARTWSLMLAPLGLPVAVRINFFAAVTTAVACGFFFLVAHRILLALFADLPGSKEGASSRAALVGAALAALLGATAFTVWNQSNVNEKVYTLSVMIIAAVSWLALRWKDRRHEDGSVRYLLAAIYLMVLGSTNHLMSLLPAPALLLFVFMVDPKVLLGRTLLVRGIPLILLGLSFNFFLPIRAAQNPVINEGHPACERAAEAAVAVFTAGLAGCPELAANLTREQYGKPSVLDRQAPFGHQLLNYFQYFDWQWARGLDPSSVPGNVRLPVTLLFLGLGFAGLAASWRADRQSFIYVGTLTATLTIGLVFYLNFRYGFSLGAGIEGAAREVRERDYFFIASFIVWGVLSGIGLAWAWSELAERIGNARRYWIASPLLVVALVPLVLNWAWATRADDYSARDWAYNLLMSVEPYGVLFTHGDNDTFPLWYLQEVEEIRQDVTVIVVQYLQTAWYPGQLQHLTLPENQRPFRPEFAMGVYDPEPTPPTESVLSLAPGDIDRIVGGPIGQDYTIPIGEVAVAYPAGLYLSRADRLALAIIRDSVRERPVYFAVTGQVGESLGLEPWTVLQGFAFRLSMDDPPGEGPPDPSLVRISSNLGGNWVNVDRTLTLVRDVFSYRSLMERDIWAERATLNIPWHFYLLHLRLADASARAGESQELVDALIRDAEGFLVTADGGRRGTP